MIFPHSAITFHWYKTFFLALFFILTTIACGDDNLPIEECQEGVDCPQYYDGEADGDDDGTTDGDEPLSCDDGQYLSNGLCENWTNCEPGEFVLQLGSTTEDRMCDSCSQGTFSDSTNMESPALVPVNPR